MCMYVYGYMFMCVRKSPSEAQGLPKPEIVTTIIIKWSHSGSGCSYKKISSSRTRSPVLYCAAPVLYSVPPFCSLSTESNWPSQRTASLSHQRYVAAERIARTFGSMSDFFCADIKWILLLMLMLLLLSFYFKSFNVIMEHSQSSGNCLVFAPLSKNFSSDKTQT